MELGDAITFYRKQKGYTQAQLAELADTSNRYISRIENGMDIPKLPKLQAIAGALDVPLWALFYGQADTTQQILTLLVDCSQNEQTALFAHMEANKRIMRRFYPAVN